MARIRKESLSMAKSCLTCRYASKLQAGSFCTRLPPRVEVTRSEDGFKLDSWYPPIPTAPCGEHKRRWFGALKAPSPQ